MTHLFRMRILLSSCCSGPRRPRIFTSNYCCIIACAASSWVSVPRKVKSSPCTTSRAPDGCENTQGDDRPGVHPCLMNLCVRRFPVRRRISCAIHRAPQFSAHTVLGIFIRELYVNRASRFGIEICPADIHEQQFEGSAFVCLCYRHAHQEFLCF